MPPYLIEQYSHPTRAWPGLDWGGPVAFLKEIWPRMEEQPEFLDGLYGHGAISP